MFQRPHKMERKRKWRYTLLLSQGVSERCSCRWCLLLFSTVNMGVGVVGSFITKAGLINANAELYPLSSHKKGWLIWFLRKGFIMNAGAYTKMEKHKRHRVRCINVLYWHYWDLLACLYIILLNYTKIQWYSVQMMAS